MSINRLLLGWLLSVVALRSLRFCSILRFRWWGCHLCSARCWFFHRSIISSARLLCTDVIHCCWFFCEDLSWGSWGSWGWSGRDLHRGCRDWGWRDWGLNRSLQRRCWGFGDWDWSRRDWGLSEWHLSWRNWSREDFITNWLRSRILWRQGDARGGRNAWVECFWRRERGWGGWAISDSWG